MLGAGQNGERIGQVRTLQAAHGGFAQLRHQVRIFGKAFIGAAPALILCDRDAGREGPLNSGGAHLLRGDAGNLFHQRRIARASQADVMREDHRAQHVVVAVERVHAVEQRDAQAAAGGALLNAVVEIGPRLQAVTFFRVGTAAAEHRAERVRLDLGEVLDLVLFGLCHLADFFVERHACQERLDLRIERGERRRRGGGADGRAEGREDQRGGCSKRSGNQKRRAILHMDLIIGYLAA